MADEIILEFLSESREGVARIESDLLQMEQSPDNGGAVDQIFRDVHTIKGVCGFLGFTNLEGLTHSAESLLSRVRSSEISVTPTLIEVLLATVDAIRTMLLEIEHTERDGEESYASLVATLGAMAEGTEAKEPLAEGGAAERGAAERGAAEREAGPARVQRLGEALVDQGVSQSSVDRALAAQRAGDTRRLGQLLLDHGAVSKETLDSVLALQLRQRGLTSGEATIRVQVELLDRLMNMVGELVLVRNQVLQQASDSEDPIAVANAQRLNLVTSELQESVMKTRMQPIGSVWAKLPRVVRDLGRASGKMIRLSMSGRETELDKTIIEAIGDPLMHLVRNACDHGLESAADRRLIGKPEEGNLQLRAFHEGGRVIIEVSDDGAGIDPQKVVARALTRGLISPQAAEGVGDREAMNLIFLPGFSTSDTVTNISGRGVGMDVVKTNVERIAGTIEIHSDLGVGTTIRMKIPLTLAIIPALIVDSRSECYAIPQVSVRELVLLDGENLKRVKSVNGTPVYRLRGRLLPLIFLAQELDLGGTRDLEHLFVVVLTVEGADFGLVVDGVRDTEEIVVKPLGYELGRLALYAGATIRGDGSVALILDVAGLAHHAGVLSKMGGTMLADESSKPVPSVIPVGRETFLLFEGLRGTPVAVPLARIERLEEFDGRSFELVSGQDVVQYRSEVMPVVHLSHFVGGASLEECRHRYVEEPLQTVVFRRGQHSLGLVVSQLVDIVEAHVEFRDVGRRRGILGTAVMQSKVVELLDIDALLDTALPRSTGTAVGGS